MKQFYKWTEYYQYGGNVEFTLCEQHNTEQLAYALKAYEYCGSGTKIEGENHTCNNCASEIRQLAYKEKRIEFSVYNLDGRLVLKTFDPKQVPWNVSNRYVEERIVKSKSETV